MWQKALQTDAIPGNASGEKAAPSLCAVSCWFLSAVHTQVCAHWGKRAVCNVAGETARCAGIHCWQTEAGPSVSTSFVIVKTGERESVAVVMNIALSADRNAAATLQMYAHTLLQNPEEYRRKFAGSSGAHWIGGSCDNGCSRGNFVAPFPCAQLLVMSLLPL